MKCEYYLFEFKTHEHQIWALFIIDFFIYTKCAAYLLPCTANTFEQPCAFALICCRERPTHFNHIRLSIDLFPWPAGQSERNIITHLLIAVDGEQKLKNKQMLHVFVAMNVQNGLTNKPTHLYCLLPATADTFRDQTQHYWFLMYLLPWTGEHFEAVFSLYSFVTVNRRTSWTSRDFSFICCYERLQTQRNLWYCHGPCTHYSHSTCAMSCRLILRAI